MVCQVSYTRYQVLFYFWWKKTVLKLRKISKYYEQDCRNGEHECKTDYFTLVLIGLTGSSIFLGRIE